MQKTYVLGHGVKTYRLDDVVDAFQFAIALIRIREWGRKLHAKLSECGIRLEHLSDDSGTPADEEIILALND